MGAEEDGFFTVDPSGYSLASGGFNACLRDLGRFAQLYLDDGLKDTKRIIPSDWIKDVRRGQHGLFPDERRRLFA